MHSLARAVCLFLGYRVKTGETVDCVSEYNKRKIIVEGENNYETNQTFYVDVTQRGMYGYGNVRLNFL